MGLLSKLDAVNRILLKSGRSPVSTLGGTSVSAPILAEKELDDACRRIQAPGLSYNTTIKVYSPDTDGRISLPSNTLSADGAYTNGGDNVTVRGGTAPYLYDMADDTDVFTDDVYLRVVRLLAFVDMPDSDQEWATDLAAQIFQMTNVGDQVQDALLGQIAATSRAKARAEEARRRDSNVLDNTSSDRLGSRRQYRRGSW